ncbi:MAG: methyl-accepting chemotaxis protein [Pseudomonadota bacterium]
MLIKRKLQLTGLSVVVIIVIGIAVQYTTLNSVVELSEEAELLSEIEINMDKLIRHERDFLAHKDPANIASFNKTLAAMLANLGILKEKYFDSTAEMRHIIGAEGALNEYKKIFEEVVALQKRIGLGPGDGLYGQLRAAEHKAEVLIVAQKSDVMLSRMLMLQRHEEEYMRRRDEAYVKQYETEFKEFMQVLATRSWPTETRKQVADLTAEYRQHFMDLIASERIKGAKLEEGKTGQSRSAIQDIESVLDEMNKALQMRTDKRVKIAEISQIAMAVAMLVFVMSALFIVYKRLVGSLDRLLNGMANAAKNKDLSIRIDILGVDEFAQTAHAFNQMSSEYDAIMRRLSQSSLGLSTTASELNAITERTNQGVNRQYQESDQVATAMNEMAATVQEVARNAAEAAKASGSASEYAMQGKDVVTRAGNGLRALADEVTNTAKAISQLEKESDNIGTVLSVIQSIAEQTNLLALNAAIEAARAGESGRGFAVVADEVRTLAQRSKVSTEEIKAIIERLQTVARTAVQAMDAGLKQSSIAVEQADAAGATLEQIANAVLQINDMNSQIATAAEEQYAVAETVNASVTTIASISDETAQLAKKTLETGNHLATLAMELHQAIGVFKLGSHLDLSKAKSAHLAWKAKLRSFLDGQQTLSLEEAVSHKHCVLGKWYYSDGLQKFGHIQAMQEVEHPHAEMHGLIKNIIELKQKGDHAAAEKIYAQVAPLSERIVALLSDVEQAANAAPKLAANS